MNEIKIHITEAIAELDLDNALDFICAKNLWNDFDKWTRKAYKNKTGLNIKRGY